MGVDIYGGKDPHTLPMFTRSDVARWLSIPYSTLRRWYPGGDMSFNQLIEAGVRRCVLTTAHLGLRDDGEPVYHPAPGLTVDPQVAFGAPTISGTGIKARVIAGWVEAGMSIAEVAAEYGLGEQEVKAAVTFEKRGCDKVSQ